MIDMEAVDLVLLIIDLIAHIGLLATVIWALVVVTRE